LQTIEYGWFVLAGLSDVRFAGVADCPRMDDPITNQAIEVHHKLAGVVSTGHGEQI